MPILNWSDTYSFSFSSWRSSRYQPWLFTQVMEQFDMSQWASSASSPEETWVMPLCCARVCLWAFWIQMVAGLMYFILVVQLVSFHMMLLKRALYRQQLMILHIVWALRWKKTTHNLNVHPIFNGIYFRENWIRIVLDLIFVKLPILRITYLTMHHKNATQRVQTSTSNFPVFTLSKTLNNANLKASSLPLLVSLLPYSLWSMSTMLDRSSRATM